MPTRVPLSRPGVVAAVFAALATSSCVDADPTGLGSAEQPLIREGGGAAYEEPSEADSGHFREVVHVELDGAHCSGTIVAPYTVVTAQHCLAYAGLTDIDTLTDSAAVSSTEIGWDYGTWQAAVRAQANSYVDSPSPEVPGLAKHDMATFFVPAFSPAFLAENGIVLPNLDPHGVNDGFSWAAHRYHTRRQWGEIRFDFAFIGQLQALETPWYLVEGEAGDSGSMAFGVPVIGSSLPLQHPRRNLIGTAIGSTAFAPLAYDVAALGQPLDSSFSEAEYLDTVAKNQLWLRARLDDVDEDGFPTVCDGDPGSTSLGYLQLRGCPSNAGGGIEYADTIGQLECKDGYLPIGVRGTADSLVRSLGLRCRSWACFERGCTADYETDVFGATDLGTAFNHVCPAGQVLVGMDGRHYAGQSLREVAFKCAPYTGLRDGSSAPASTLPAVGNNNGGSSYGSTFSKSCEDGRYLAGVQARGLFGSLIAGLQPICSKDLTMLGQYAGGTGGDGELFRCPPGQIAVGTAQKASPYSRVGFFGVLCAPRATVEAGASLSLAETVIAHGSYYDTGVVYPASVERWDQFAAYNPYYGSVNTRLCSAGNALRYLYLRAASLIDRIDRIGCVQVSVGTGHEYFDVDVGGMGGSALISRCDYYDEVADGLYIRSGWETDAVSLHCQPRRELPYDQSCDGVCGGFAGTCYCDAVCTTYGDCCVDYDYQCN